jgi:hypothetical protein
MGFGTGEEAGKGERSDRKWATILQSGNFVGKSREY